MKHCHAILLVLLAGCAEKHLDPWARKPTEAERAAWGASCGPIYGRSGDDVAIFYETKSAPDAKVETRCFLDWDPKRNRLRQAAVLVSVALQQATAASDDQVAPYFALIEALLPPEDRPIAREIAFGTERFVQTKHFEIDGGHDATTPYRWTFTVRLR